MATMPLMQGHSNSPHSEPIKSPYVTFYVRIIQGSHSNDRNKFKDFSPLQIPKIMTYSSIIYGLLTRIRQPKNMNIELPVPITDSKTMLRISGPLSGSVGTLIILTS